MPDDEARALLARLPHIELASCSTGSDPILRTLDFAVLDDAVVFHGAPAGEKLEFDGRRAVVAASETVAKIPSYFLDPLRACPATTLYRSVQVHGTVETVHDNAIKARALEALMQKYQPEGGYRPMDHRDPLYAKAIAGLLVMRVPIERIDGKAKLAQNRSPADVQTLCERLWQRGGPGDLAAIEAIRAANPSVPDADFLRAPDGVRLVCACDAREESAMLGLLRDQYWNVGVGDERLLQAHRRSAVWVGARDERGELVATARALADGGKFANIYDVAVHSAWRGRGVGEAVIRLLMAHPLVRDVRRAWLRTRDAEGFYRRFGFEVSARAEAPHGPVVEMTR